MRWQKKGLLFAPKDEYPWMGTFAALPVAEHIAGDRYCIYFSGRDSSNRSHPGQFEIDITKPKTISSISSQPVLALGLPGTFDDSGSMTSWVINHNNEKWMYYIGWNLSVAVPFRNSLGLAISRDGGGSYKRYSDGPIMDRSMYDPTLVASACVLQEKNVWRMWYLSGLGWFQREGQISPRYHIKYAESDDGRDWKRNGHVCIDFQNEDEYAISRPCVVKEKNMYKMWYSYRGDHYRIGYAESEDGLTWERKDSLGGLDVSEDGWDSEMVEYPLVFDHKGTRYMFYNGNGFGKTGIGYAIYE